MSHDGPNTQPTIVVPVMGEQDEPAEVMTRSDARDVPSVDRSPPRRTVLSNVMVLAGGQATTWTMALLWTLVVPRLLGPSGMGLITASLAITSILGLVLDLGTQSYLAREMAARPDSSGQLIGSALVLRVVMCPLFIASVTAFAHFADYGPEARLVLWLATTAMIVTMMGGPLLSAFQATEHMQYLAYSDVISQSAQGVVGIVVVVIGFGAAGLAGAALAVSTVVFVLGLRWLRPLVHIEMRTTMRKLFSLSRNSISYFALNISNYVYTWIDSVMLSLMAREQVVGWYAAPTNAFGALLFIPVIMSTAWQPRLVRAFENSEEDFREAARAPVELVLVLALPVCAATALAARSLIPILYGHAYRNSVPIMVVLGFTAIPMYANTMFASFLVAMRRQAWLTWLMAGAALANPGLNFFLIRFTQHRYGNGGIGAATCLLITELLIASVELMLVGRRVLSRRSLLRLLRSALATGGMWVVGYVSAPLGWWFSLPLAGVAFLALAWLLRVAEPEEKAAIRSGLAKVTPFGRRRQPVTKGE